MKNLFLLLCISFACYQAKAQDTCATALTITVGEYVVDAVNGSQVPSPICAPNGEGATAGEWYKYTAAQDLLVTINTNLAINEGKDTRIHIYSGTCGNLTCAAGNDDTSDNYLSTVTFTAFQGQSYYVAFDNKWSSSGFTFQVSAQPYEVPPISFTPNYSLNIPGNYKNCVVDMNGDYLDDIVGVSNGNIYIMQQQEGGFNTVTIETESTNFMPSWSIAAGDLDGNGFNDLLYGGGSGVTFKLANQDGTAYSQINSTSFIFSQRTNFVDINNDGHLDAFICHDVEPNVYYMNDGETNLTFYQGGMGDFPSGGNYGSLWFDFDNDGDLDLFISKCRGGNSGANINELHRNNGDGTFTNIAPDLAMDDPIQTWSSAVGDFDNDGDMDIMIGASSFANGGHILKRNNGDGTFTDVTAGSGFETFNGQGYEYVTHDFNNDGYLDILTSSQVIFLGNGDLTFSPINAGVPDGAVGDLNNDGFLDVQSGGTVYFNNGNNNNWIKFSFEGIQSNRNGIGARVEIHGAWGMQIREVRSGDGFRNMSSLNVHFGIGEATEIEQVVVKWPSGVIDYINNPDINQTFHVQEGASLSNNPVEVQTTFRLYPNPTDSFLHIDSNMTFTQASIYDISGKLVMETQVTNQSISVNELAQGTYILLLRNQEGKYLSNRFIKK
jgi:hypothetical protein